jgi:hypothetical protein
MLATATKNDIYAYCTNHEVPSGLSPSSHWLSCPHLGFDLRLVGEDDHYVAALVRILHLGLDVVVEELGQGCGAG